MVREIVWIIFVAVALLHYAAAANCNIPADNSTCTAGNYFDSAKQVCSSCKICKSGYGVRCGCRFSSNTECEKCPKGTFSKLKNGNRHCELCTVCPPHKWAIRTCNTTDDTECVLKPRTSSKGNSTVYVWIIAILSVLVLVAMIFIIRLILCWRAERNKRQDAELVREGNISTASEAPCIDTSFSDLDDPRWRKHRSKYNGSLSSSLDESRCRLRDDRDSIQSSHLSSEPPIGSDRARRTLYNPDVMVATLPASVYQELGKLLNPSQAYRDWQTLAGKLGRTQMDIENIKVHSRDFTEQLLHTWCTEKPGATISHLLAILIEMNREDAAAVLFAYDAKNRVETKGLELLPHATAYRA